MAEKVPGWLERILLPQISELKGEVKVVYARVDGLEAKMEGEFKAVHAEISRLEGKIDGVDSRLGSKIEEVDRRLGSKIDELDKRLDVTQRLTAVEEQLKELRAKA